MPSCSHRLISRSHYPALIECTPPGQLATAKDLKTMCLDSGGECGVAQMKVVAHQLPHQIEQQLFTRSSGLCRVGGT